MILLLVLFYISIACIGELCEMDPRRRYGAVLSWFSHWELELEEGPSNDKWMLKILSLCFSQ